jgi:hypothetical protein
MRLRDQLAAPPVVVAVEPPRSWPKEWKLRFMLLPADLQAFIADHESKRDKEVRRCQAALDVARKKLEKANAKTEAASNQAAAVAGSPATSGPHPGNAG